MRASMLRRALLVMTIWVCLASDSIADEDGFKIIVHPRNPATSLTREFVRDAYLKKITEWNNGEATRPIDLTTGFPARARFTQEVLNKTLSQIKSYWTQQVFSGKGVPPPEARSVGDLIDYVLANPGAVGYLPASVDPRGAKVVRIN